MATGKGADPSVQVDAASVFGASVQLPMFDRAEPDAWFILADANFNLRKVTDSRTKYWYVLPKFDLTTLRKLSTFLQLPRGEDPYQELREMLCQTYESPLEQKVDAFLAMADMGDERPAKFALELQCLTAKASMDDVRKRVSLRCLPRSIVTAIPSRLGGKFLEVVQAADRAWTAAAVTVNAPSAAASVSAIVGPPPATRGRKRGGRQRGGRAAGQVATLAMCSFHRKFGDAARKCPQDCSRWENDDLAKNRRPQRGSSM